MIPDRMYTDGGLAMEQDPADYCGDSQSLRCSTWSDMEKLGVIPEIRERYCRDRERFRAELQAVTELVIWFGVWKRLREGYELKGWLDMPSCGGVPLYERVRAPRRDD